jgi:acetolactate synthase-1/2/3 large subunit
MAGAQADGYSRISENIGCAMTTSGPGVTNLTTSIANAYYDSIPCIFITGQVATFRIKKSKKLRQKGFQETDVEAIYKPITKYAVTLRDPKKIRYELEKAVYLARIDRGGPVMVDIPDDLQREEINPDKLISFTPLKSPKKNIIKKVLLVFQLIEHSKKPVLILGSGVRTGKSIKQALAFAQHFGLPILLTWGGKEMVPFNHPLNMGVFGVCGPRWGNFAVQNSDLIIAIGTRLSQLVTGGKQNLFAPKAKKVMIDIDHEELNKFTRDIFKLDIKIESNNSEFFDICQSLYRKRKDLFISWRKRIREWREKYPICPSSYYAKEKEVNPYVFVTILSRLVKSGEIITADTGATLAWIMQTWEVKENQRIISAWNHTPMGYSLPAAIGAAFIKKKNIICLIGDGGLMMCLQELATVARYHLPIKIFVFSNHCHGIQKQTIDTWLNSNYTAVDEKSGLFFPDFTKVAQVFGLATVNIRKHKEIEKRIEKVLKYQGPVLCNIEIYPDQKIIPMLKFGNGLEDLDPKLSRKELAEIMKEGSDDNKL